MKSKHYRKDVIMARVIFGLFCIAVIALLVMGGMWLVKRGANNETNKPNTQNSESQLSENSQIESESESESESETQSETESETESEPVEVYGKITASSLNLRKEANTSSDVLTSLKNGTKVLILEELTDWYKISYDGMEGYVSAKYVEIIENTVE